MPYEISSLQKNAAPDEAVQSRGYILIEHMGLDKFGKLVRDIRITRSLLLYDMAKTLDILQNSMAVDQVLQAAQQPFEESIRAYLSMIERGIMTIQEVSEMRNLK